MFMILGIDVGGTHTDSVLMKGRENHPQIESSDG